jgi:hypothetical protein
VPAAQIPPFVAAVGSGKPMMPVMLNGGKLNTPLVLSTLARGGYQGPILWDLGGYLAKPAAPAWAIRTEYPVGTIVNHKARSWKALVANPADAPGTGGTSWQLMDVAYVGDPRTTPELTPLVDAELKNFLQRVRDAGYTPGATLRWNRTRVVDGIIEHSEGTLAEMVADAMAKVAYCRDRSPGPWIFYYDSTHAHTCGSFREIQAKFPDCVFLPEHHDLLAYSCSVPYHQSRGGGFERMVASLTEARQLWPNARASLWVNDESFDRLAKLRPQILQLVREGAVDIVGNDYAWVAQLYKDARK